MIHSTIGNYKILRLIGEGGMASVYESEHLLLGTRVAIKVLNPLLSSNAQIKERFKNEAKLMASLDHPNILKVLDFDDQPQQLSIIMEFLEGEDLNKKIKQQGALKESEIVAIFTQTLAAFQYAHDKGIVHRDIKPSNLYILPDGTVKILDFGIAKLFGQSNEMTQTGTQMGTPIYMSPEQVRADKTIDFRSDIYSLGVTLYYALNGKPPYDSNTSSQFDIFSKIVYEPLTLIGKHGHFDAVISKACAKDREERYQSCMLFLAELNSNESSSKTEEKKAEVENTIIETKKLTNEVQEKTIIETPIESDAQPEKTIVENENSDRKENKSEPKIAATTKKRNRLVFLLIFGIILLASLAYFVFFLIDNKDSDGDGMKDKHDHCPYEYGLIGGCPDRDQDAIPDYRDDCPDEAGENERGCPETELIAPIDNVADTTSKKFQEELNFNGLRYYKTPIKINPKPRNGSQNVFFDKNFTLFDQIYPEEPIFPVIKNGKIVYQIYYSSNEDPNPYYGEFTPTELQKHLYYKFKNKSTCLEFCRNKKSIVWQGQNSQRMTTKFKKTSSNEWVENNSNGNYYYWEVKHENGNYILKDKNREDVYIFLSNDKAYYKDNNNSEWIYIYNGNFK